MTAPAPDDATLSLVLDAVPAPTVVVDRSGRFHVCNGRFRRELVGDDDVHELGALADEPAEVDRALALWFGSSSPRPASISFDGREHRCDGARLGPHELAMVRCLSKTEAVEAFSLTARAVDLDRLERTKARLHDALAEVEAANEALRASNTELERFASVVSHDLRSPLIVIRGMAELLEEALEDQAHLTHVAAIIRNAKKMELQISGILEVARSRSGTEPTGPASLDAAVASVRGLLAGDIERTGADIEVGEGLPSVWVLDAEAVQLLQNLLQNAIKYAHPMGPPRVRIRAEVDEGTATVTVEDNGPGVPPDERDRVFELFERGSAEASGNGIGLAACRSIVHRRGGEIWIEDSVLGGAAVRFTLPTAAGVRQTS